MKNVLPKTLAAVVTFTGLLVIIGWIFNIPVLTSILPQWVTMKFTTALSFVLSGMILYASSHMIDERQGLDQVILTMSSLFLILIMATLLASVVFGIRTGMEDLFVKEERTMAFMSLPGRPSIGTIINFILVACIGLLAMSTLPQRHVARLAFGWIITVMGALALFGYAIHNPMLFFALEGISPPMAFHTAVLFLFLGIGFITMRHAQDIAEIGTSTP